jgi:hypothetical protein
MPQPVIVPQTEHNTGRQPLAVAPQLEESAVLQNSPSGRNNRIPVPPQIPNRTEQPEFSPEFASDIFLPVETVIISNSETVISDRVIDRKPVSQGVDEEALKHPLSGIDLPERTDTAKSGAKPWTSSVADAENNQNVHNSVPLTASVLPVPPTKPVSASANAFEQKSNLDEFNSRLAKIQLEKKNLTAALSLIGKIKSPEFKVKTLVDLAEYVSRDSSYKKEADSLYELAVAGIDALSAGKPVVVKIGAANTEPKPEVKPVAPKKSLTLIDETESLPKPAPKPTETKPVETKVTETKSDSKKKLTLVDEADEPLPRIAPKPAETRPAEVKKTEPKPVEELKPEEPKPAETKQPETAPDAPVRKPMPKRKIVVTD